MIHGIILNSAGNITTELRLGGGRFDYICGNIQKCMLLIIILKEEYS